MAPMILESEVDDDDNFVRTISDNEQDLPLLEEEGVAGTEPAARQAPWENKRKRQTQEGDIGVLNKKQKKEQRRQNRNTTLPNGSVSHDDFVLDDEEDETWDAQGEDDGAMDSNFEFQIGTVGTQVLEVFDGWGEEGGGVGFTARETGDKKGVDIDELIARRRKVGNKEQLLDDDRCNDQDHYNSWDAVSIDSGKDDDTNAEDEVEDEDETIADDAFGMGADEDEGNVDGGDGHSIQKEEMSESDEGAIADAMPNPEELEDVSEDEDDAEESAKKIAFFAPEEPATKINAKDPPSSKAFQSMNLSRPILRGLALVGFTDPTPIQIKAIPIALLAKDVVGGAVTGSGKTGAFIIPILERLLHRPKRIPTSRVAILLPTRELAVQCFNVAKKLASFTDITFALLTGGFSLREQESVLRSRPDVIIATPGRFIDHMRNSASFTVDTLEILVLDEADRILEDGFADELNEILTTIPRSRQTMLFSATMTDRVDKLIRVGLNRPVRLIVDARKQTVVTLTQEFVRLRPGREDKRLGYLSHLCSDVFTERVIIFFRQKKEAHRVRVIFGLLGIRVAELHGSMTQEQVSESPIALCFVYANPFFSVSPRSHPSVTAMPPTFSLLISPPVVLMFQMLLWSSTTKHLSLMKFTCIESAELHVPGEVDAHAPSLQNQTAKSSNRLSKLPKPKEQRSFLESWILQSPMDGLPK